MLSGAASVLYLLTLAAAAFLALRPRSPRAWWCRWLIPTTGALAVVVLVEAGVRLAWELAVNPI